MNRYITTQAYCPAVGVKQASDANQNLPKEKGTFRLVSQSTYGENFFYCWEREEDKQPAQPPVDDGYCCSEQRAEKLARYLFSWFENRNNGELQDAFWRMRKGDYALAEEELAYILKFGERPPNWVKR